MAHEYSLPCCPPSGTVLDVTCFRKCVSRVHPDKRPACVLQCTVSCADAKLTGQCCPDDIPEGCPDIAKHNYLPGSNPTGKEGPGGVLSEYTSQYRNNKICCIRAPGSNGQPQCVADDGGIYGGYGLCTKLGLGTMYDHTADTQVLLS